MELENKVALVPGAGSGIGKAAAICMAREGARVGALDDSEDRLSEILHEIQSAGGEVVPLTADVSNPEEMQAAVQKAAGQ